MRRSLENVHDTRVMGVVRCQDLKLGDESGSVQPNGKRRLFDQGPFRQQRRPSYLKGLPDWESFAIRKETSLWRGTCAAQTIRMVMISSEEGRLLDM